MKLCLADLRLPEAEETAMVVNFVEDAEKLMLSKLGEGGGRMGWDRCLKQLSLNNIVCKAEA